jgi:hypothetical protein
MLLEFKPQSPLGKGWNQDRPASRMTTRWKSGRTISEQYSMRTRRQSRQFQRFQKQRWRKSLLGWNPSCTRNKQVAELGIPVHVSGGLERTVQRMYKHWRHSQKLASLHDSNLIHGEL